MGSLEVNSGPAMLSKRRKNRAIVLLIVLGMLALFSVLVVTYVVFSSQMQQAAYGNSLRRERELQIASIGDSVIRQIVAGGSVNSATYNQDLLSDLYGTDHIHTRVAHQRQTGGYSGAIEERAMLLRPFSGTTPQTTLFKFHCISRVGTTMEPRHRWHPTWLRH